VFRTFFHPPLRVDSEIYLLPRVSGG
jgi:hypothetical protein